jgi:nucleoside-diphosphate-sugar epimerase
MGTYIVTGAAGYIGRFVAQSLADEGHTVLAIVRDASQIDLSGSVVVIQGDLWDLNLADYESKLKGSTLIHLAWQDGFVHSSDAHMGYLSNHFKLVRKLIELGVKRVVGLGTMHELGPQTGLVSEDAVPNPQNQYGIAKNALRVSLNELCGRLGVTFLWLRCFYILGDDVRNHSVFTKMLLLDEAGEKTMPLTLGTTKFDFIQVDELGAIIAKVSGEESYFQGVLNIGSGIVVTLRERLEEFHRENNLSIELEFGAFPERQGIAEGCWPNLTRLHSMFPRF